MPGDPASRHQVHESLDRTEEQQRPHQGTPRKEWYFAPSRANNPDEMVVVTNTLVFGTPATADWWVGARALGRQARRGGYDPASQRMWER